MVDRIAALRLFSRVARSGSFSQAGRAQGLSQPSVSRVMTQLEEEVGAALLVRTTRAVTLTEAGAHYLPRVERILAELDEADHDARGTGELRGTLRIGVSTSFCMRGIAPVLSEFLAKHPALRIELAMSDNRQDLVQEGIDVVIRFGQLTDSNAIAKHLGATRRLLVAAPSYLRQMGTPQEPDDLAQHELLIGPSALVRGAFTLTRSGRTVTLKPDGRLRMNVNEVATTCAVQGLGILATGDWGCRAELESGQLVEVLSEWSMGHDEVHALYVAGSEVKPSARAFVEQLASSLRPDGPPSKT